MQPLAKKDLLFAAIIGFIVAAVLLLISQNVDVPLPFDTLLLIIFPILSVVGLYVAWLLGRIRAIFFQFAKFGLVGALNTFVDIGVLNLFILATSIAEGVGYNVFKGVAFLVAVTNSYFWNKLWTFQSKTGKFAPFLLISLIGLAINVGAAHLIVNVFGSPEGFTAEQWANIGAIVATFASFIWNYAGYKKFVFKPESTL